MKETGTGDLKELLIKCWMTHDGSWFASVLEEYGIDAANRMNKAAISKLAPLELRRVIRAAGLGEVDAGTAEGVKEIMDAAFGIVKGDFMDFTFSEVEPGVFRWKMNRCFALEGMKVIGAYEYYECGVLYRVLCWLDALGVSYDVEPPVHGCLMRDTGDCGGLIRLKVEAC